MTRLEIAARMLPGIAASSTAPIDADVKTALAWADALLAAAEKPAAAPPVAAVKFTDDGDACGDGWGADVYYERDGRPSSVVVSIDLRPGEDAGETLAKALAACGRGP